MSFAQRDLTLNFRACPSDFRRWASSTLCRSYNFINHKGISINSELKYKRFRRFWKQNSITFFFISKREKLNTSKNNFFLCENKTSYGLAYLLICIQGDMIRICVSVGERWIPPYSQNQKLCSMNEKKSRNQSQNSNFCVFYVSLPDFIKCDARYVCHRDYQRSR